MSFPLSPANNQTTIVNGINYIYNSTNNAWKRVPTIVTGLDPYAANTANAAFIQANNAYTAANTALSSALAFAIALG
jgi:hypothetical protein